MIPQADWQVATAIVAACEWTRLGASGFPSDGAADQGARYLVRYAYSANGTQLLGEFMAAVPVAIGHRFSVRYDPCDPWKNTGGYGARGGRRYAVVRTIVFWLFIFACLTLLWSVFQRPR
jgi:hypothetical protein